MPPTFTLIENGQDFRPEITEEQGGWRGVRHGWFDTADITDAILNGINYPKRGDPWDALAPNLIVQKRSVMIWDGNTSLARLDYATPGLGGGVLDYPAQIGKPITISAPSQASVTAKKFLLKEDPSTPGAFLPVVNTDPLIAQGQGVTKEVGLLDERVKVAYAMNNLGAVPWARIRALHTDGGINDADISLPNYFGSGYAKPAPRHTLRYRFAEYDLQADLFVVTHVMASAENHIVEYEDLDEDGNVQLPNKRGHIYPFVSLAGLW